MELLEGALFLQTGTKRKKNKDSIWVGVIKNIIGAILIDLNVNIIK